MFLRSAFASVRRSPSRTRCALAVEPLEDRLTPTSTASILSDGVSLAITGDAADDNIVVTEGVSAGAFTVIGGGLNVSFSGIVNIYVNTNGGADQSVTYLGAGGAGLSGKFGTSDGSTNSFDLTIDNNANIGGRVAYQENGTGVASVNLGVTGGATSVLGDVIIFGGSSDCTINVNDITMGFLSANYNAAAVITVNVADQAGEVNMGFLSVVNSSNAGASETNVSVGAGDDVTINGNVYIIAGREAVLDMTDTTVLGYVSFNAPNAASFADVTIDTCSIQTFLSLITGAGDDIIAINDSDIGQNFAVITNDDTDSVFLSTIDISGVTTIDTGIDDDEIYLDDDDNDTPSIFTGLTVILAGDGDDTVVYATDANDFARFFSSGVSNGGPAAADTSDDRADSDAGSPSPIVEINFENII